MRKYRLAMVNAFLISLMVAASLFCWYGQALADQEGDFTYTISAGGAQIHGYTGVGGDVTIPETLGGFPVTCIADYAFFNRTSVTNLNIPQGVTIIGEYAFASCSALTSLTLPTTVKSIGAFSFQGCTGLTSINILPGVESIGYYAFSGCVALTSLTLPTSVTSIAEGAFSNCDNLTTINVEAGNLNFTSIDGLLYNKLGHILIRCPERRVSITLPEGVTSIGQGAFEGCTGLLTVTLPDGLTSIGKSAFAGCTALSSITLPTSVTGIGTGAFSSCANLTGITIPQGVTSIGDRTFGWCTALASITIPTSVTSIGERAFYSCTSLTGINIPQGVTSIGNEAFAGCSALTSITISSTVTRIGDRAFTECTSLTYVNIPQGVTSIGVNVFSRCISLTTVNILPGVTNIGEGMFLDCTSLTNVILPEGLTSIGQGAFVRCTALSSITLPNSVTAIGLGAFSGCANLRDITIPQGVTSIGSSTFADCSALTSITIPSNVISIGTKTFSGCANLTSITVAVDNRYYKSIDGVLFNKAGSILIVCPAGLTSIIIPQGVTSIGTYAFEGCRQLTSITFPDGLTSIGDGAFFSCSSLTSITLPSSVISIGAHAFGVCSKITSVTIPQGVTSIGNEAFVHCIGLSSITFNSATTAIYDYYYTIPNQAIIIGYDPSTAKDYATKYGRTFKLIGTYGFTNGIHLTQTWLTENDIKINGQGVGYAYFRLINAEDGNISPLANRTITYSYSGYGDSYTTTSDDDGEIIFTTPPMYDSQSLTLNIQSISGTSEPVESQTFDVQVMELSFDEEWEGTIGIGAGAEVGIGVGGAIGIAEAEAVIAGVGLKANSKPSMTLRNSYDNGIRSLELTNGVSGEVAATNKVGLFGKVDIPGADIDINPVGIKGEAAYGKYVGIGLKIDDYDPYNIDNAKKIGVYLLNNALTAPGAMGGSNVVTAKLLDLININVYDTTKIGSKVMLAGGAEIGSFEVQGFEPVKLVGGTATTTFAYDKVQESDGDYQYETGYKTEGKISFAEFGDIPPILSVGKLWNDVSLTANHESNEQSLKLETAGENNLIEILWYEESIGEKTKLQFSGAGYSELYNGSNTIKEFCDGSTGYFSKQNWADTVTYIDESKARGTYSVGTEKAKGIDVEIPLKLKVVLGAEIILYSSGLDTVTFDTENGVLSDGRAYKHSKSVDIDSLVDANRLPLTTILKEPIAALGNMVGDFVSKVGDSIVEGVQNGAAVVVGVVNDVSNRIVNIFRITTPFGMQKSYVIMALPSEYSILSETYVAVTVGEPYIVMVTDADGIEIPEFEPLSLEISYDDTMLATAGIAADSTLIDRMKIYYWDEAKATYLNRGGLLDKVNKKVTLEITKGGQYILAIDNLGPDISNFTVANHTATPLLSAYITDLSGIDESTFRFSIDDNTLVNGDNFTDHFNYSTSKFSYQVQEPLTEGEHTASIIVNDTSGNALPQAAILQFSVDTQPPTIVEVNIPEAIIAGEELAITATTSEANRASVCIAYPIGEGWSDFETLSMTSPSENTWNTIIRNTSISNRLKVKVLIYDAADNVSASPEVIVKIAPPVSGYTLSGQVLVEGDDLAEGQIHYSGGATIELKQGEEIKYSTTSSEAADLASNGTFSLTGIADGDYTVVISKAGYLTRSFALTINSDLTLSTSSNQYLNRIYLLAGDIVSDEYNVIAASDVNYILSKFNSNSTQAGFDPQVDIVKDQYNVISAADVNLMLSNFNKNSTQYPADIIY